MKLVEMSTAAAVKTTTNPGEQVLIGKHKNCFNKNILKRKKYIYEPALRQTISCSETALCKTPGANWKTSVTT